MSRYSVPVIYTVVGWIEIEAPNKEAAEKKAAAMNENGVNLSDVHDSDSSSEVLIDELELMR